MKPLLLLPLAVGVAVALFAATSPSETKPMTKAETSSSKAPQVLVTLDDGLHGKGFEVRNPNASSTCGCGKSFS